MSEPGEEWQFYTLVRHPYYHNPFVKVFFVLRKERTVEK